jgi:hypothetical protein
MIRLRKLPRLLPLLAALDLAAAAGFRFEDRPGLSLALTDDGKPVLAYQYGLTNQPGVPADRMRSSYIHPLHGLDGEILTDDFPADHYHHRGLFWAWPHVAIQGREYDLWMLKGVAQRFERWLARETFPDRALLGVENGWYVADRKVMQERLWLTARRADADSRCLDLDFTWIPIANPISLAGAEGKSYGGLTLRFAPRTGTTITTPLGNGTNDLYMTRLPWADLSAVFPPLSRPSGAAVFLAPDHPDFPPTWLTRHYGVLCLGWPGVETRSFPPDRPIRCRYRVWVHRNSPALPEIAAAYERYRQSLRLPPPPVAPPTPASAPLPMRAVLQPDRVRVFAENRLFTEYVFGDDTKYPFFYPLVGPRSGRSVTTCRTDPYPHHSSLFFGCDRVNGGNYWQEGLERGRIASRQVRVLRDSGPTVELEQDCEWVRPGADSPFTDRRHIAITAPAADRRVLDFDITLSARRKVRIEKTNHSLFSARIAPELSAYGSGALRNAAGDLAERGTFGKPSPWADFRGRWDGVTEGLAIFNHPDNRWSPVAWFTRDYGFFSPTPLFWLESGFVEFEPGQTLRLRYRVVVHADDPSPETLGALLAGWH